MHTLLLGFDAFDPRVFERLHERGLLPHLSRFVEMGGYSELEVANPPQSEVSWTSIATGLNPGGHGMFDFVHREPASHTPFVSLLPSQSKLGVTTFVRPYSATTIFDVAAARGYPATALWWPGTFPARPESPVRTIPGLGTPDIFGRLGVGCLYTTDRDLPDKLAKTPVLQLQARGGRSYEQRLMGPTRKKRSTEETLSLPLRLSIPSEQLARLQVGEQVLELVRGEWSPIVELRFKVNRFVSVRAVTRVVLTQTSPTVRLYFLPLQLHPLGSIWPYGTPNSFVKRTWGSAGPFLTLGWPQDTAGLEDGCINDQQFLALCESISDERARVLLHQLSGFREGLLAAVFDTIDRVQHMYWRDRPDVVDDWYVRLDGQVGEVLERYPLGADGKRRMLIVSDHGFERVDYLVHLNRWLIERGYLGHSGSAGPAEWKNIDWQRTQAYAIGLNSVYLNLSGREGRGIVDPSRREETCERIRRELLGWVGPDGRRVVESVWLGEETFSGSLASYGPDIVVGYSVGYRASSETGLGGWGGASVQHNREHWSGDHCFDVRSVPGVLFVGRNLADYPRPSYRDIPELAIDAAPEESQASPPPTIGDETDEMIEERLRSLGYL